MQKTHLKIIYLIILLDLIPLVRTFILQGTMLIFSLFVNKCFEVQLHLTYRQKRALEKLLPFVIISLVFGAIYAFIEKGLLGDLRYYPATNNIYDFESTSLSTIAQALAAGLIFGSAEVFIVSKLFKRKSFGVKLLFKIILYGIGITLLLVILTTISSSLIRELPLFHEDVRSSVMLFMSQPGSWSILIYMGALFAIAIFVSEISDNLGQGVLTNLFFGKYHKPREEDRIFMFLDMRDSTTMAESLGHVQYFKLLNEYYADITEAIIQTEGTIYQYVGDEVIVSWNLRDGLKNNNCLNCFMKAKEIIAGHANKYMKEFGLTPSFKAGMHFGPVSTGRIGIIKKEIVFTGDVLNTTARIQSLCNSYNTDLLISSTLLEKLDPLSKYETFVIGECKIRGKHNKIELSTVMDKVLPQGFAIAIA